ncbi:MAG: DUF421 domain-containing protein [Clostridia bacterium]
MFILFLRAIILYLLVFCIIRLTGKRQISDLQPFDLIVTLLIADLASEPAANTGIPLMYGIVPILALFLVQQLMAFMSLKSQKLRSIICGEPMVVISRGVVVEHALRVSRYTLGDLMEQLRGKDVFELSYVEFAVLETNGDLSVLLKGEKQTPSYSALRIPAPTAEPPYLLVQDGKIQHTSMLQCGKSEKWLTDQLARCSVSYSAVLFAFLSIDGTLHVQTMQKAGGKVHHLAIKEGA